MPTEIGKAYVSILPSAKGFGAGLGSQINPAKLGAAVGGAIGVGAAIGFGKASVGVEAQFSRSMALIGAATGTPQAELNKMRDLAIDLGAKTSFSANQAADAMLELGKAGISSSDIMGGALKGTLTLAAAGSTDLATAATIGSNAMNTFGLKGKDMASIAAALAGGANASSASVESLGEALSQVGPGAKNAGFSLQETVGVLSAFDAAGIKGSDAGTSLKTMLTRLVPKTEAASGAMEEVGLWSAKTGSAFVNSNGTFKTAAQISGLLHDKLGNLTDVQKEAALSTIFGSDASRAASVLMDKGAKGIRGYIKATKDQGAAEKMAKANMAGTAGALERLSGSVETAQLKIGMALAPAVQKTADVLGAALGPAADGVATAIGGVGTALTATTGFLDDHSKAAGIVAGIIATLLIPHFVALGVKATISGTKQAGAWLATQAGATKAAAVHSLSIIRMIAGWVGLAIKSVAQAAIMATAWVIGIVVPAAGAVISFGIAVIATVAGWVAMAIGAMANAVIMAAAWFIALGPIGWVIAVVIGLVALIILNWDKVKSFTGKAWDWVAKKISGAWQWIKDKVSALGGAVMNFVKSIPGKLVSFFLNWTLAGLIIKHWDSIKAGVERIASKLVGFVKSLPGKITDATSGMWDGIKNSFKSAINWVIGKWNSMEFTIGGGSVLGKEIPKATLSTPNIPLLANGGIVKKRPGGIIANIGEGNDDEAVIPLRRLSSMIAPALRESELRAASRGNGGRPIVVNDKSGDPVRTAREVSRHEAFAGGF